MRAPMWAALATALVILGTAPSAAALKDKDLELEKKMGQEGAAAAQNELKFTADASYVKRVETIGQRVAAVAKVTKVSSTYGSPDLADFDYSFKVVDDKEINAFSLPAGYIYINKGLIDEAQSDAELAGVLAHEVAHVAHHHMLKLVEKQSRMDGTVFLIIAAAVIGKVQGQGMQNIFYGAQLIEVARLNAYSQKAEDDADAAAIQYMLRSDYNPVGLLTFMERLAHKEALDPNAQEQTVLATHPPARSRAKNILAALRSEKVPINRRAVSGGIEAAVREGVVGGKKVSEIVIGRGVVFQAADTAAATSAERAKAAVESINRMLATDPQPYEVRVGLNGSSVYVKQEPVVEIELADALLAGASQETLAKKAKESIQAALASDLWQRIY